MRRLVVLAALVAGLPWTVWAANPMPSNGAPSEDDLNHVQRRLGRAQSRLRASGQRAQVLSTDIAAATRRIDALGGRLAGLQAREAAAQARVDLELRELDRLQRLLRAERARLVRLRARLVVARRALADRLVTMYKADEPDVLTVVLNADGFKQLLEDVDFIRRISRQDRAIVERVRAARAEAARQTRRLQALEVRQRHVAGALVRRRDEIARLREAVAATRAQAQRERAARQQRLARVRVSRRELVSEVASLRSSQRRIRHALVRVQQAAVAPQRPAQTMSAPLPRPVTQGGGGRLIWPVSGPITSPFCERRSWEACHPGLDIAAPEGTPIRAAAAGVVALMQPTAASGGYGNYTCVLHAGALSTCYAHQARFGTVSGARVTQGQVIGYVGNTGRSFGAHLHFEVRLNGNAVNPVTYLG